MSQQNCSMSCAYWCRLLKSRCRFHSIFQFIKIFIIERGNRDGSLWFPVRICQSTFYRSETFQLSFGHRDSKGKYLGRCNTRLGDMEGCIGISCRYEVILMHEKANHVASRFSPVTVLSAPVTATVTYSFAISQLPYSFSVVIPNFLYWNGLALLFHVLWYTVAQLRDYMKPALPTTFSPLYVLMMFPYSIWDLYQILPIVIST